METTSEPDPDPQPSVVRIEAAPVDRGQELPSWMTSMVLHLAIIILFASLAVKDSPQALFVIDLTGTMADQTDDNSNDIEIMPFESLTELQGDSNTTFVAIEDHVAVPIEALTVVADLPGTRDTEAVDDPAESSADSEEMPGDRLGSLSGSKSSALLGRLSRCDNGLN